MKVDSVLRHPGRLFTFGCSMTRYHYPTWADIIGCEWQHFENWGRTGAGNSYIFNSIMECLGRNRLTENDTVLVLWSSISRIDAYQYNDWVHHHSIFPNDSEYGSCPRGYEIQSYAWIYAVDLILSQSPCQYFPMTWVKYDIDDDPAKVFGSALSNIKMINLPKNTRRTNFYSAESFARYWQELYDRLSGPDWPSLEDIRSGDLNTLPDEIKKEIDAFQLLISQDKRWNLHQSEIDCHPSPLQHLNIVEANFPDLAISSSTRNWIKSQDQEWFAGSYKEFTPSLSKKRL